MHSRTRILLIILSVSLNVAFVTAWGMKTLTQTARAARPQKTVCMPDSSCRIWCPLHRALGTTAEQWRSLEPLQRDFQTASATLGTTADSLRGQLMDLLAEPQVNPVAIEAKEGEIGTVQQRMQRLVVNHLLEEKRVLNATQQTTLFAMMRNNGGCVGHAGIMSGEQTGCQKNHIRNDRK
ncbi:MAG TPA: periplasmic heavy metal sensor [bacterium]|jgi:hypothetical protein